MKIERFAEALKISSPGGGVSEHELQIETVDEKIGLPPETFDYLARMPLKECVLWLPEGVEPLGEKTEIDCTAEYSLRDPYKYTVPLLNSPQGDYGIPLRRLGKPINSLVIDELPYVLLETREASTITNIGPITLDMGLWSANTKNGSVIEMTKTELQVLEHLALNIGVVCPREDIYENVWGGTLSSEDRSVDVVVRKIRKKLQESGIDSNVIKTRQGVGYFIEEDKSSENGE